MDWPEIAGDPRFFQRAGPHSLAAVADAAEAEAPPRRLMLAAVAPLQTAGPGRRELPQQPQILPALEQTDAGAVIVHPDLAAGCHRRRCRWSPTSPTPPGRGSPHCSIRCRRSSRGCIPARWSPPDAMIDPSAEIGPLAVIGAGVEIGPRCCIAPLAVLGRGVVLGPDCRIGSHASVSHALLGARVYIYPGARIGQEGFGFATTPEGFRSVPQLGRVILEDDVEVGANTTIDRGSLQDTVVGAGSRLDNLVQIGHNVHLGRGCVVVAQVGIAGSTILEDHVMIGGQAGVTGHLRVGRKARIGAQAGVMSDVPAGADVVGSPAQPVRAMFREIAFIRRLVRDSVKRSAEARSEAAAGAANGVADGHGLSRDGRDHTATGRHRRRRVRAQAARLRWSTSPASCMRSRIATRFC